MPNRDGDVAIGRRFARRIDPTISAMARARIRADSRGRAQDDAHRASPAGNLVRLGASRTVLISRLFVSEEFCKWLSKFAGPLWLTSPNYRGWLLRWLRGR